MKRRHFMRAAAAGTLATAAFPTAGCLGGEFTGVIKKAIKFNNIKEPKLSVLDKFKLIKDLGYDGVELRTSHVGQKSEFIAARDKTGLPIHGLVNSDNPDLQTAIEFCAAVGGDGILITAPYDKKRPLMESWKERQDIVRAGLASAEKHRVKILVEN